MTMPRERLTPKEVQVATLVWEGLTNREIGKIVSRPDIKAAWAAQGAIPVTMTQPEFKSFVEAEIAKWAKLIKDNHIALIN